MKICIFSPNAAILPHFFAELRIADIIVGKSNHELQLITCNSFFENSCTSSTYLGDNSNELGLSSRSCITCQQAIQVGKTKQFENFTLNEFLTETLRRDYERLRPSIKAKPIDFEYMGVPLGRMSLYEIILEYKKSNLDFTIEENAKVRRYTENSLKTFLAALNYLECHRPGKVIIFNPQYGVPASFAKAAELKGIPVYSVSFTGVLGEMRRYVRGWPWNENKQQNPLRKAWFPGAYSPSLKDLWRLKREQVFQRTGRSPWTYSQPASRLKSEDVFSIPPGSKVILAVMNSTDEVFAAKIANLLPESTYNSKVFSTQEDWIERLIHEVAEMEDTYLIVRPHPREYPNKRENVQALTPKKRSEIFQNLPRNVLLDSPTLGFPLENHFRSVSVLTTGWSSVGLDWQMRGKPTVTYDKSLTWYPSETHYSGTSVEEYFWNIKSALYGNTELNDIHTRNAVSWYCFSNFEHSFRLGSSIFDEWIIGPLLAKIKLPGLMSRVAPRLHMRLRTSRALCYSNKKGILELFEIVEK